MSRQILTIFALLTALGCATACAAVPMYEEEPYDQITLNAANGNKVYKVKPMKLTNRQLEKPPKEGKIVVRLVDEPEKAFEIAWRDIADVKSFGQLVMEKANEMVKDGKFDAAYDYFAYLQRTKPAPPGLEEAFQNYLYEEAKAAHLKGQYDGALALLREVYRRNPNRPGIDAALGRTTDELVGKLVEQKNYPPARALLKSLSAAFPDNPVAIRWRDKLQGEVAPLLPEANAALEAGQLPKAAELSRRIAAIWPELPGARELAVAVHRKYPRLVVGVGTLAVDVAPGRPDDWTARRSGRLLYRTLTEFAGPSIEGGKYDCPFGEITTEALGRRLSVKLKPNVHWAEGKAVLSNTDVARRLLAMADPQDPAFRLDWSDLMLAVSLRGADGLTVEMRRPHVRPEAMLQIALAPFGMPIGPDHPPPPNGPMIVKSSDQNETIYTANTQYFAEAPGRPMEIVERRYETTALAARALRHGDIDVLDRVNPWSMAMLEADERIVVQSYSLPLVHCLACNPRRLLMNDRNFRRAINYGISRQAILEQILSKQNIAGCVVTSSPFPLGIGPNDPMGYASDENIEPRPYEPRLAMALAHVARINYNGTDEGQKNELKTIPPLVLAHPPDEIARGACASIQKQLKQLDITVELRPLKGPLPLRVPDDVDLLYVELAVWEPAVDARRLLGENGLTGQCSAYMSLALRQLDEAVEWVQVRDCLRRIHRIAFEDTSIIPLWQLVDHFAYHRRVQGIVDRPVSLYQNVEQWRPAFLYPTDK
jgi:tetratricopeptide (TPR) repeat protein